jgi:hypothetical protein
MNHLYDGNPVITKDFLIIYNSENKPELLNDDKKILFK